jgi:ABC-2 type transport system ATP-binding protein/lipopolysaccharide transport system ATP-binding protein
MVTRSEKKRLQRTGLFSANVHALKGISLEICDGERVGLLGLNGSGKTTLLKVLSGAYEPTSGSIISNGSIGSLTDLMIGMDPEATGYENVRMKNSQMGGAKRDLDELYEDVKQFTGLGEYLDLPIRTYSSGMVLRLAVALSTTRTSEILLMDEMIGVGDMHFVQKTEERIQKIMSSSAILVLASHSDGILRRFCSRGIVLNEGTVVYDGAIDSAIRFYSESPSQEIR